MSNWGFWEWLTYTCIAVAALVLAADAAVKGSPEMMTRMSGVLSSRAWNFAPLVLVALSALVILGTHTGILGNGAAPVVTTPAANSPVPNASLTLRFFGDQRTPERLSYDNIFRWYSLRNIFVTIDRKGKETPHAITTLFLTFDKPVIIGTFTVTSPDMPLPRYEVKDFNPRTAVVVFSGEVPPGTLVFSVHQ